jgi:hypothetical protein
MIIIIIIILILILLIIPIIPNRENPSACRRIVIPCHRTYHFSLAAGYSLFPSSPSPLSSCLNPTLPVPRLLRLLQPQTPFSPFGPSTATSTSLAIRGTACATVLGRVLAVTWTHLGPYPAAAFRAWQGMDEIPPPCRAMRRREMAG